MSDGLELIVEFCRRKIKTTNGIKDAITSMPPGMEPRYSGRVEAYQRVIDYINGEQKDDR